MKIVIDSREQAPFEFAGYECSTEAGTLYTGDYSLPGLDRLVAVERKSVDDLLGCLVNAERDRFERELARASGLERFAVVVEASYQDIARGRYRSRMKPHAALQSLVAFQVRYNAAFVFAGDRAGAEYFTHSFFHKYLAEARKRYGAILKHNEAA